MFKVKPMSMLFFPVVVAVISAGVAGCEDERGRLPSAEVDVLRAQSGPVGLLVHRVDGAEPGVYVYSVQVSGAAGVLAAIQGELNFPANAVEFVGLRTPTSDEGGVYVVNTSEVSAGRVRFAAFAPEALATDEVFELTLRHVGAVPPADVVARLQVAGDAEGTPMSTELLPQSSGLRDPETGREIPR